MSDAKCRIIQSTTLRDSMRTNNTFPKRFTTNVLDNSLRRIFKTLKRRKDSSKAEKNIISNLITNENKTKKEQGNPIQHKRTFMSSFRSTNMAKKRNKQYIASLLTKPVKKQPKLIKDRFVNTVNFSLLTKNSTSKTKVNSNRVTWREFKRTIEERYKTLFYTIRNQETREELNESTVTNKKFNNSNSDKKKVLLSSILTSNYKEEEISRIRNLRRKSIKNIYNKCLSKLDPNSSHYIIKNFETGITIFDSNNSLRSKATSLKDRPKTTSQGKRKDYGRWYLSPNDYNTRYKVLDNTSC